MSRAIHEAISSWLFQDLSIVKKNCGHFGMIGITRLFAVFVRVQEMVSKSVFNFILKPSCYDLY